MARINGGEPLFTEGLRDRIANLLEENGRRVSAQLLAVTVLHNELHLVILQGTETLTALMQPLLVRVAALVQRTHLRTGYVFNGRFKARLCGDARKAILWAHWLPVQAGQARRVGAYAWSSHHAYAREDAPRFAGVHVAAGLNLFAGSGGRDRRDPRQSYRAQIRRRVEFPGFPRIKFDERPRDLPAESRAALHVIAPDCDVEWVREPLTRSRALLAIRRQLITKLRERGYSGRELADFFGVSPSVISRCRVGR